MSRNFKLLRTCSELVRNRFTKIFLHVHKTLISSPNFKKYIALELHLYFYEKQ